MDREDDFASNGLCGLAGFTTAFLKCLEAQARGFAHGHGKIHSLTGCVQGMMDTMDNVVREIEKLKRKSADAHPAVDDVIRILEILRQAYNERLLDSATTRQYESATLPARQLGQAVRPSLLARSSNVRAVMMVGWKRMARHIDLCCPLCERNPRRT